MSTSDKSSGLREMAKLTKMRGGSAGSNKRSTRELTHRAPLLTPTTPLRDSPRTWLYPTSGIHQRSRNLYRSKCSKASRRATRKPCTARRTRQLHQQQHSCNSPAAALGSRNPCLRPQGVRIVPRLCDSAQIPISGVSQTSNVRLLNLLLFLLPELCAKLRPSRPQLLRGEVQPPQRCPRPRKSV